MNKENKFKLLKSKDNNYYYQLFFKRADVVSGIDPSFLINSWDEKNVEGFNEEVSILNGKVKKEFPDIFMLLYKMKENSGNDEIKVKYNLEKQCLIFFLFKSKLIPDRIQIKNALNDVSKFEKYLKICKSEQKLYPVSINDIISNNLLPNIIIVWLENLSVFGKYQNNMYEYIEKLEKNKKPKKDYDDNLDLYLKFQYIMSSIAILIINDKIESEVFNSMLESLNVFEIVEENIIKKYVLGDFVCENGKDELLNLYKKVVLKMIKLCEKKNPNFDDLLVRNEFIFNKILNL